jgi:hypothetical protein
MTTGESTNEKRNDVISANVTNVGKDFKIMKWAEGNQRCAETISKFRANTQWLA